jgi:hypothetical protein
VIKKTWRHWKFPNHHSVSIWNIEKYGFLKSSARKDAPLTSAVIIQKPMIGFSWWEVQSVLPVLFNLPQIR